VANPIAKTITTRASPSSAAAVLLTVALTSNGGPQSIRVSRERNRPGRPERAGRKLSGIEGSGTEAGALRGYQSFRPSAFVGGLSRT
jgi:hypothetical protein